MAVTVGDWVDTLERLYAPAWAEEWDAVGLVVGDPQSLADRALWAIDPTEDVVDEAVAGGFPLLITHHPLLLRGVHGVAETDAKGRLVTRLVRAGIALFTAHTNADAAAPGVSDSLAAVLGVGATDVLDPTPGAPHRGLGRVGQLGSPATLGAFVRQVADALPATAGGVRVAGDRSRRVQRVAVCGGSGSDFLDAALRAGADAYVTADVRHHAALEAVERGLAVIDVAHWASEAPWLPDAAALASRELAGRGHIVATSVSTRVTDPWRAHESSERTRP